MIELVYRKTKNPLSWTVSASVDTETWDWIELTRGEEPRRAFIRRIILDAMGEQPVDVSDFTEDELTVQAFKGFDVNQ